MMKASVEEDVVVKEIPIYLSKNMQEQLYVYQYPLRSVSIPGANPEVLSAKVKPNLNEVEMEVSISTRSCNYNQSKGEQMALNCDGADKHLNADENNFFHGSLMDKMIYTSEKAQLDPSRYAVGYVSCNELHLNPVHSILHVKPAFQYLDKTDRNLKSEHKDADSESDEEDRPQQVTVRFSRSESDKSKSLREKSFGFLQKKNAEETWVPTEFHPASSEFSQVRKEQLLCSKPEESVALLTLSKRKYLRALIDKETELEDNDASSLPMTHIRTLALGDQVKQVMINVKVASFGKLCKVLDVQGDNMQQQLLRSLQQVAVLVQGNWVVRSDVIYTKDKLCGVTGISHEICSKVRDYLLFLFTNSRYVDRNLATITAKISTEDVKEMLQQVSTLTAKYGWEFKLPFDQQFVNRFPDVVQRQEMLWKARQQQLQLQSG